MTSTSVRVCYGICVHAQTWRYNALVRKWMEKECCRFIGSSTRTKNMTFWIPYEVKKSVKSAIQITFITMVTNICFDLFIILFQIVIPFFACGNADSSPNLRFWQPVKKQIFVTPYFGYPSHSVRNNADSFVLVCKISPTLAREKALYILHSEDQDPETSRHQQNSVH